MHATTGLRPSSKVKSDLARTAEYQSNDTVAIGRLRQEYKASRVGEYLQTVVDSFPPLMPSQIAELQGILAGRTDHRHRRAIGRISPAADSASVTEAAPPVPNMAGDGSRGHGRTQWDAMTEAISSGRFPAVKLGLLIFVRYGLCTSAGLALAYKITELIVQHR